MKKALCLLLIVLFLTGCTNVNKLTYKEIINNAINSNLNIKNKTGNGYTYYLPDNLSIYEDDGYNVILKHENYNLYMYLDLISYYNKVKETYTENKTSFYSMKIENNDKFGYLEINLQENEKYLIEIMYNYAKIEVIVDKMDINEILSYSIALLSSIEYNDTMIASMIDDDTLNYNEVEYNIFDTNNSNISTDSNDTSNSTINDIPDTDLVN